MEKTVEYLRTFARLGISVATRAFPIAFAAYLLVGAYRYFPDLGARFSYADWGVLLAVWGGVFLIANAEILERSLGIYARIMGRFLGPINFALAAAVGICVLWFSGSDPERIGTLSGLVFVLFVGSVASLFLGEKSSRSILRFDGLATWWGFFLPLALFAGVVGWIADATVARSGHSERWWLVPATVAAYAAFCLAVNADASRAILDRLPHPSSASVRRYRLGTLIRPAVVRTIGAGAFVVILAATVSAIYLRHPYSDGASTALATRSGSETPSIDRLLAGLPAASARPNAAKAPVSGSSGSAVSPDPDTERPSTETVTIGSRYDFGRYLGYGDTGPDVRRLQEILSYAWYYRGSPTGTYDAATGKALAAMILARTGTAGAEQLGPKTLVRFKALTVTIPSNR